MAPLPQNNTDRLFLDYVTGNSPTSREHTFQVRFSGGQGQLATVQSRALGFLSAPTASFYRDGWRVIRARYQAGGTNFSVPVSLISGLAAFVGNNTPTYAERFEAVEITFQGRSFSSGRRVDVSLYTALSDAQLNFRVPTGPTALPAQLGAMVAQLNGASADNAFLSIDGTFASFYSYANYNYNSYWERRSRTT